MSNNAKTKPKRPEMSCENSSATGKKHKNKKNQTTKDTARGSECSETCDAAGVKFSGDTQNIRGGVTSPPILAPLSLCDISTRDAEDICAFIGCSMLFEGL